MHQQQDRSNFALKTGSDGCVQIEDIQRYICTDHAPRISAAQSILGNHVGLTSCQFQNNYNIQ